MYQVEVLSLAAVTMSFAVSLTLAHLVSKHDYVIICHFLFCRKVFFIIPITVSEYNFKGLSKRRPKGVPLVRLCISLSYQYHVRLLLFFRR